MASEKATTTTAKPLIPTEEELQSHSVSQLKQRLSELGVTSTEGCIEKSDLVRLLLKKLESAAAMDAEGSQGKSVTALVRKLFPAAMTMRHVRLTYGEVAYVGNTRNPTAIVTFCHGLGDTCDGWAASMQHEVAPSLPHVLFILPTAAEQAVSMNMGMAMPAWYDIKGLGPRSEEDPEGVLLSAAHVEGLVAAACAKYHVPRNRVVMAGFSQGAALSLAMGLLTSDPPAAIAALSGYLAARAIVVPNAKNAATVPITLFHGTSDPVVPLQLAQASLDILQKEMQVANVELKQYPGMAHSSSPREMRDFVQFLQKYLPAEQSAL